MIMEKQMSLKSSAVLPAVFCVTVMFQSDTVHFVVLLNICSTETGKEKGQLFQKISVK